MTDGSISRVVDVLRSQRNSQGPLTWSGEDWPVLWNAMAEAVQEGLCLLDHQGCVVSLNREARRLIGWAEHEVMGKRWHDLVQCLATTEHMACPIDMAIQDRRTVWGDQVVLKTRTNGQVLVSYTCVPTGLGPDSPAVVYRFRDLGTIVHLTAELRSARAVMDGSPAPMVELNEHGMIIWANATMLHYLDRYGYRPSMVPSVLPERLSEVVTQCLEQERPVVDLRVAVGDLRLAWMFQRIPGLPRRVCAYGIPVMIGEESVASSVPVPEADVLERFASAVSYRLGMRHEALALLNYQVRSPLQDILGMVDLLDRTEMTTAQRTYVDAVRRACEDVVTVLNELRTLVKVETEHALVARHPFVLGQLLEEAISTVATEGMNRDVDIVGVIGPDCWQVFEGDADRVAEIARAVVRQAVRNSGWGHVTVRGSVEPLDAQASLVTVTVRDVGPSIEQIVQTDVLDELRSVRDGLDPALVDRRSVGFEFPLAKRLCGLMGGSLKVHYAPHEGNTYEVRLRLVRAAGSSEEPQSRPWACKRALVIGGHPVECEGFGQTLQRLGIPATFVETIADAYGTLRKGAPDGPPYGIVFVNVPRGEEIPLCHLETLSKLSLLTHGEMGAQAETVDLPIVVMLDGRALVDKEAVFHAGIAAILRRPIRTASLEVCLQTVLGERRWYWMEEGFPMQRSETPGVVALTKGRVLVIEDNPAHQVVARALLESLGYAVDLTGSARAGIEAFRDNEYCAVLCDCYMPEIDGYSVVAELRRLEAGERHTPIIGLSADHWNEAKGRAVGIDRFLTKPIALADLQAVLDKVTLPAT